MSGVSLPVTRPPGRALIVGQPAFRNNPSSALQRRGYVCTEVDEPYDAMVQLCRRPLFYSAVILSLNSLYREELAIISSIKKRFSHVDIWLSDTDGRQAALAEAMRFGADGLLSEDGMHRIAGTGSSAEATSAAHGEIQPPVEEEMPTAAPAVPLRHPEAPHPREKSSDPLLTAEELRALLQESPGTNAG
jgi:DNA-binding NarL/FixJ family response regulator